MEVNPSNPSEHGNIPIGSLNRIMTLKDMYMKNPTQKFPGLTAVYDFMVSGTSVDTFLKRKDVGNLTSFFNSDD